MANQAQPRDPSEFTSEDDIDEILGRANPNPTRVGCPPRGVLIALARRQRPIEDPAYEHLVKCSPCYQEFRALQQVTPAKSAVSADTRRWWLGAAAAAVLIVIAGAWFFFRANQAAVTPGEPGAAVQTAQVSTELDLRKYTVARTEQAPGERPPLSVPRGQLS